MTRQPCARVMREARVAALVALVAVALTIGVAGTASAQGVIYVPRDTLIRLERTAFDGPAPVYTVAIDGDGTVFFSGQSNVSATSPQQAVIPVSRVAELLTIALAIHFFEMDNSYRAIKNPDGTLSSTTDRPTTTVTITLGRVTKRVENYFGAPDALVALENAIDEAAGTKRWIYFDKETLEQLLWSGWLASGYEGTKLLLEAIGRDDIEVARTLIEAGADMNGLPENRMPPLMAARSAQMVELLAKAGADPNERPVDKVPAWTPLMSASQRDAAVARALLKAGARLEDLEDGRSALWFAACRGNWQVVDVLLRAGANIRGAANTSAVDCARGARRNVAERSRKPLDKGVPTVEDFDRVILLLETAGNPKR